MMKRASGSRASQQNQAGSATIKAVLSAVWDLPALPCFGRVFCLFVCFFVFCPHTHRGNWESISARQCSFSWLSRSVPTFSLSLPSYPSLSCSISPFPSFALLAWGPDFRSRVMALSGSCSASPKGPQRQIACQGVVTEVDCHPPTYPCILTTQPHLHGSHLSN